MAHLLTPPGVHHRRKPLWVALRCGGCRSRFVGNAFTVPQYPGDAVERSPACRACWRRLNLLLRQANLPEWETPEDAYPDADPDQVRDEIPSPVRSRIILPSEA
jgi:hypothetical protein